MADHAWLRWHGLSLLLACSLIGCAKETTNPPQSAAARAYDQLASAIRSCASAHARCDEDDGGSTCTRSFTSCRESAGRESERALAEELGACLEISQHCTREAEGAGDAGEPERCRGGLRECIGESRLARGSSMHGAASPDSEAPTYQCFGELRECVTNDATPQACGAAARDCVIRAVGNPEPREPREPAGPADAGRSDAGKPAGADAATPRAGTAAPLPEAGRSSEPPSAGADAEPRADGGVAEPGTRPECMARHEACLAQGGKPMQCAHELRKCGKAR
jgi:hypothetical protein